MPNLNQLTAQVIDAVKRPSDTLLKERVKDIILQYRLLVLHRAFEKYGIDREYVKPYVVTLEAIDKVADSDLKLGYTFLRSTEPIPPVIRVSGEAMPFVFCGSLDHSVTFQYATSQLTPFHKYLKYNGSGVKYDYVNSYLEIRNNIKITKCLIEAPFEILDISLLTETTNVKRDNMDFPLYGDMLNDVITASINYLKIGADSIPDFKPSINDLQ